MDDHKKINFAKLMLRSQMSVLRGEEQEQRARIITYLKAMKAKGYSYEQMAYIFGQHLKIAVQPGHIRVAMQYLYEDTLRNFIITADRRDKACANCPLRTFPFSMEFDSEPTTKE